MVKINYIINMDLIFSTIRTFEEFSKFLSKIELKFCYDLTLGSVYT